MTSGLKPGLTEAKPEDRTRYRAWWAGGPGLPCLTCTNGTSDHAGALRKQGRSFFPMRIFGPDRPGLPVRYLLVGMEPSESRFDRHLERGRKPEGAVNFGGSSMKSKDSILQFSVREWLCEPGETFLLTDMAKCAVRDARAEPAARQRFRWDNCAGHLESEAALFDLRAVIALGPAIRDALRKRTWVQRQPLFRVMHFASRAHQQHQVLTSDAERSIDDETVERFEAFVAERRAAVNNEPQRIKVSRAVRLLLAVYRKQFGCIRQALSDPTYECARRADDTCCKAVARRKDPWVKSKSRRSPQSVLGVADAQQIGADGVWQGAIDLGSS